MERGHQAVDKEALTAKPLFGGLPSHHCWGPALFQRLEFIINEVGEVRLERAKLATRNTGNQYLTYRLPILFNWKFILILSEV